MEDLDDNTQLYERSIIMATKSDNYFSNKDEYFELNSDMLEKVASGKFTLDPNDPDFDTYMYYGEEYWEKYCQHKK